MTVERHCGLRMRTRWTPSTPLTPIARSPVGLYFPV
jgi:hypothetical protein